MDVPPQLNERLDFVWLPRRDSRRELAVLAQAPAFFREPPAELAHLALVELRQAVLCRGFAQCARASAQLIGESFDRGRRSTAALVVELAPSALERNVRGEQPAGAQRLRA